MEPDRKPFDQTAPEGETRLPPPVLLPSVVSRLDGACHDPDRRVVRFAEALAFDDSWSAISEARRRAA